MTKQETKMMKGMAILLMLMHHLFILLDRIIYGHFTYSFTVFGQNPAVYIGAFGKICVSLFFFLGGYGIYKSCEEHNFNLLARLKKLYLSYWKVFVLFIPLAFLFLRLGWITDWAVSRYRPFSFNALLQNFFGLSDSYNGEWWFLFSYAIALCTYPLIVKIFEKHSFACNTVIVCAGSIFVTSVFPHIDMLMTNTLYKTFFCQSAPFIACFWMGVAMAKSNMVDKLYVSLKRENMLNPLADVVWMAVLVYLRENYFGDSFDIFTVPMLIVVVLDLVRHIAWMGKALRVLGMHSTNMWLCHSFFCYYFAPFAWLVSFTNSAVISLLTLVALSLVGSVMIDRIWDAIGHIAQRIFLKKVIV